MSDGQDTLGWLGKDHYFPQFIFTAVVNLKGRQGGL